MEADEKRLVESTRQIYRLYHNDVNIDKAVESMEDQDISAELVNAIYTHLSNEADKLMTERFHYYNIKGCNNSFDVVGCWTSRYLFAYNFESPDSAFHAITIFDSFHDKSIKFYIEKSAKKLNKIYPLNDGFALLKEAEVANFFISLVFLDFSRCYLQKLHTVERHSRFLPRIVVNKADPTTFMLNEMINGQLSPQICKIIDKTIVIEDVVESELIPDIFYDKYAYTLELYYRNDDDLQRIPQIYMYNVENKTDNYIDIEIPAGYRISRTASVECVRDVMFVELEDRNDSHVIGCLNVQTRKWNILDFCLKVPIRSIDGLEKDSRIIFINSESSKKHYFYKIPFGKPESLESIVWFSLVKAMKKHNASQNPYEAARKYLPSTSVISCPFDRSNETEEKCDKVE